MGVGVFCLLSFVDLGAQVEVSHDDSVMVGDSGDGFYAFKL